MALDWIHVPCQKYLLMFHPLKLKLFLEVLWEMKGESKAQKKVMSIHVLDGMFLAGQDIRDLHLTERMR